MINIKTMAFRSILFGVAGTATVSTFAFGVKIHNLKHTENKIHVVMDLDHTLLHAQKIDPSVNTKNIHKPKYIVDFGDSDTYRVYTRPFATLILATLAQITNLHLFTAGDKEYADAVLNITNWRHYFQTVTTYEDADMPPKNLTLITQSRAILVDDKSYNNVPGQLFYHIPQYKGYMRTDYELPKLLIAILFMYCRNK